MSENVKANELLIRALGAGVKGNTIPAPLDDIWK